MKTIKLIICIVLLNTLFGCNNRNDGIEISDYYKIFESRDNFYKKKEKEFEGFKVNNSSISSLIKCNMPFSSANKYELAILFNNKLVYLESESDNIRVPESLKEGDIINVSVLFISDESVYKLINKYTFSLKKDIKYYYLTFLPDGSTDQFIMIPSSEYIS
ncbi:hypothetical protein [uncultured Winogradskyella sp.]|uniref:hypothetical protein n=1 Tax=uncultured Winogradskyella sp. TaxID=395353 RepID=UPI0026377512|nr:hypothetical protein [uncultured Winogradskyella sp.]